MLTFMWIISALIVRVFAGGVGLFWYLIASIIVAGLL